MSKTNQATEKLIASLWIREPWLLEELLQRHSIAYSTRGNGLLEAVVGGLENGAFRADLERLQYSNYVEAIIGAVGGITTGITSLVGQNKAQKMQEDAFREAEKQHERNLQQGSADMIRQRELLQAQGQLARQATLQGVLQQVAASQQSAARKTQTLYAILGVAIVAGVAGIYLITRKQATA